MPGQIDEPVWATLDGRFAVQPLIEDLTSAFREAEARYDVEFVYDAGDLSEELGLQNATQSCPACHSSNLRGGANGEPSCYSCHGQKWS